MNARHWTWRIFLSFLRGAFFISHALHATPTLLDIYIEENHAGTFYYLAETLPLDEPHRLILIDAHSDASAVTDSDRVRQALRKVQSLEARTQLLATWRKQGAIQCYDWLEPLMPLPFDEVRWIAAPKLSPLDLARQQTLARESLDGLLEAFPRIDGELGPRYHALDWSTAQRLFDTPCEKPTVVSVDLDYFANTPATDLENKFHRVFTAILTIPRLRTITFSISTPWLRDSVQTERLTSLAIDAATNVANARIHLASHTSAGPDRSRRAQDLRRKNEPIPILEWNKANAGLRSLLISRRHRFTSDPSLTTLLDSWSRDPFLPIAQVEGEVPDPDGHHRLRAETTHTLRLQNSVGTNTKWFALAPSNSSVNLTQFDLGFAQDSPHHLAFAPRLIGEGPTLSTTALHPHLEPKTHAGTVIVYATTELDGDILHSNELTLSFRTSSGFRAALSEGFARPYAFGCGLLPGGPDSLFATDCANFIICGLRREGWRIPWGDPKQFAENCVELARGKHNSSPIDIPPNQIEVGLFVHFGNHVGAIWEDLPPLGQLDSNDLIAHHLESFPEIVPLNKLTAKRESFRLLKLKPESESVRLIFGGDVMLGRRVAESIQQGHEPFKLISPLLQSTDWACINLECVASDQGAPSGRKPFQFRAHPRTPDLLAAAGIDAVSLANNHALDFGTAAFDDAVSRLHAASVRTLNGSPSPLTFTIRNHPFAAFACEDSVTDEFLHSIKTAAASATIIVTPHWGTEHSTQVDQTQRTLADRLFDAGAKLIIGSGPHTCQPVEFRNGTLIAWSLGNLIFDGPGPDLEWSSGTLLEIELRPNGHISRALAHPIRIESTGSATLRK